MSFITGEYSTLERIAHEAIERGKCPNGIRRIVTMIRIKNMRREHPEYSRADIAKECGVPLEVVDATLDKRVEEEASKVWEEWWKG